MISRQLPLIAGLMALTLSYSVYSKGKNGCQLGVGGNPNPASQTLLVFDSSGDHRNEPLSEKNFLNNESASDLPRRSRGSRTYY